jgi:hypothetical protein
MWHGVIVKSMGKELRDDSVVTKLVTGREIATGDSDIGSTDL